MSNIRTVVEAIGRKTLSQELECGSTAIANAISRGAFPASWYPTVKHLAEQEGVALSDDLFSWRRVSKQ